MSSVLALIPARSGSKGVSDKNIQSVGGVPLLVHSIHHAQSSTKVSRTIVSTDSEQYAALARDAGADVPFLRPAEFADDHSTDLDVFRHTLQWLQDSGEPLPDICLHLRPTYPVRSTEDIDAMLDILISRDDIDSVRSVVPAPYTPLKMWFLEDDNMLRPAAQCAIRDAHNMPRQTLPKTYMQNACIDVVRTSVLLEKDSMPGDRIYGYLMEHHFDIDTHHDLAFVEKQLLAACNTLPPVDPGKKRTLCFDIDGVIASIVPENDYTKAEPLHEMINVIRHLYEEGDRIILCTARGTVTGKDWKALTEQQMQEWGVPYHELHFGKPAADVYIDDKALAVDSLLNSDTLSPAT